MSSPGAVASSDAFVPSMSPPAASPRDGTVEPRLLPCLANWRREFTMETVLTEIRCDDGGNTSRRARGNTPLCADDERCVLPKETEWRSGQCRREMTSSQNRKLQQPPEESTF